MILTHDASTAICLRRTCIRADAEQVGLNSAPPETWERRGSGAGCTREGRPRRASSTLRKASRALPSNARRRICSARTISKKAINISALISINPQHKVQGGSSARGQAFVDIEMRLAFYY